MKAGDRSIGELRAFLGILFVLLALEQIRLQIIEGPGLSARVQNPRRALAQAQRGPIVASDGTPLAITAAGKRTYPIGPALAQTVGYISSRYGTAGLEAAYDGALSPADRTGNSFAQLGELVAALRGSRAAARGATVITTLRPEIQAELERTLRPYSRAAAIVLDPHSGAIFAVGSVPGFDPNTLASDFALLQGDERSPLLNRAFDGLYPPGSTFKIFTLSAALDSGAVDPGATFYDPGELAVGNFVVRDNENEATGAQDLSGAFALSSNVDFAQIGLKMGTETWYRYAQRWGLGESLDFQLPAARDHVPARDSVTPSILAQLAFGQADLLVSPLRMALVAATIANDGAVPRPFIVRGVEGNGFASTTSSAVLAEPISRQTAETVNAMMVAVVEHGTGRAAALPGVSVAGKTGTATNPHGRAHSWFVAFAPAARPRVALAVVVENGGYGAAAAAPIARAILATALRTVR